MLISAPHKASRQKGQSCNTVRASAYRFEAASFHPAGSLSLAAEHFLQAYFPQRFIATLAPILLKSVCPSARPKRSGRFCES